MGITSGCVGTIAALAFGAIVSTSAFAADAQTAPIRDLAAIQKARTAMQAQQAARATSQAGTLGATGAKPGGALPAEAFANVERAYPPSCLNSPFTLGLWLTDPSFASNIAQTQVTLSGDRLALDPNEQNYTEIDTVTLFRVPCSGGTSATLIEIDRPSGLDGNTTRYPTFPGVSVAIGGGNVYFIRLADDPNTFHSTTYGSSPLVFSNVFALENVYGATQQFNFNQGITLYVDNFIVSDPNRVTQFNMPAYNPAAYAEASQPLPISGYMSTNWSNPNQSGEGIVMQVYDDGDSATRTLAFAWFTYDDNHLPFWLYGQVSFAIGTRSVTSPTVYFQGGSFAPSFAVASVPHPAWGNVTFSFPDCGHMNITYNGNALAVQGPTGIGSATFQRVADVNSLVCQ